MLKLTISIIIAMVPMVPDLSKIQSLRKLKFKIIENLDEPWVLYWINGKQRDMDRIFIFDKNETVQFRRRNILYTEH